MCLYLAYTALGMATGISGPTILDLQLTVGSTFDEITYIIPGRSIGYAMGSFIVGICFSFVNTQALIAITCGLSSVFLAFLPFNRTLWGLISTFFANGLVNGMLDTGSNMFILVLWGKENGPFMQALHFAFGLGCFHAPLLAKPFLLELMAPLDNSTSSSAFAGHGLPAGHSSDANANHYIPNNTVIDTSGDYIIDGDSAMDEYTADDVALGVPYGVIAVFMLINFFIFTYLYTKYRDTKPHPSRMISNSAAVTGSVEKLSVIEHVTGSGHGGSTNKSQPNKNDVANSGAVVVKTNNTATRYIIISLATLFMHVYCGLELAFGTLITSYAVKCDLKLDKSTGAVMASVYWAFFTFFRLFAIFFADIIGAEKNIFFNFILIAASNLLLIPFGGTNIYALWAGIILMGLGTSSIWASIFGFLEDFFPVTSGMTAAFSVAACLGQSIMPFIVGHFIDAYPPIFLWVTLSASLILLTLFSTFSYLCKHRLQHL